MRLYSRILVPVAGGDPAFYALDHAVAIARDQHATLKLVTVLGEGVSDYRGAEGAWLDRERWREELQAQADATLATAADRVRNAGVTVECEVIETTGGVWKRILAAATDWHADLLVVGTHGRHGLDRLLLGSVSETLVRHGRLPLLVVPPPEDPKGGGT